MTILQCKNNSKNGASRFAGIKVPHIYQIKICVVYAFTHVHFSAGMLGVFPDTFIAWLHNYRLRIRKQVWDPGLETAHVRELCALCVITVASLETVKP